MNEPSPADELLETARHSRAYSRHQVEAREDQIIVFETVGGRTYALPIATVERTERVGTITPVPRAPAFVRGVASLRGGVLCVLELQLLLGGSLEDPGAARSLLVLNHGGRRLALLAAAVPDFERVSPDDALPVPPGGNDVYQHAIEREGEIVGVLAPDKLFELIERRLHDAG